MARDAALVANGNNEEAVGVKQRLQTFRNLAIESATQDEDDGEAAGDEQVEDRTFQFTMESTHDCRITTCMRHCPVKAWQYHAALCATRAEKAMLFLVKE